MSRLLLASLLLLAAAVATGCIRVYRPDTQQGNFVTQEMVNKLRAGMTRNQVRFVLGTPLVTDAFHRDRWDYYYYFKKGIDGSAEIRRLTLIFDGDHLARLEGDLLIRPATQPDSGAQSAGGSPAKQMNRADTQTDGSGNEPLPAGQDASPQLTDQNSRNSTINAAGDARSGVRGEHAAPASRAHS